MSRIEDLDESDDALLVAYLDGELDAAEREGLEARLASDPALSARLAFLSRSNFAYEAAFAPLLEAAPKASLDSMLARVTAAPASATTASSRPNWNRRGLLAASVALLAAGALGDRVVGGFMGAEGNAHWRTAVAEYLKLYTPQTLAVISADAAQRAQELALVQSGLALPGLRPEAVALPGIALKQAQLLQYDGKALGQILYLDARYGPTALCIMQSSLPAAAVETEERRGLNVAFWSVAGHAFMLIGRQPADQLATLAQSIAQRLAVTPA
jgi:anti-sigma factor RsiW